MHFSSKSVLKAFFVVLFLSTSQFFTSCSPDAGDSNVGPAKEIAVKAGRLYFPTKEEYSATIQTIMNISEEQQINWGQKNAIKPWNPGKTKIASFYKAILNDKGEVHVGDMIIKFKDEDLYNIPSDKSELCADIDAGRNSNITDTYKQIFKRTLTNVTNNDTLIGSNKSARTLINKAESAKLMDANDINHLYKTYYAMRWALVLYEYGDGANAYMQVEIFLQGYNTSNGYGWFQAGDNCNLALYNVVYQYKEYNTGILHSNISVPNVSSTTGGWLGRSLGYTYPDNHSYGSSNNFQGRLQVQGQVTASVPGTGLFVIDPNVGFNSFGFMTPNF